MLHWSSISKHIQAHLEGIEINGIIMIKNRTFKTHISLENRFQSDSRRNVFNMSIAVSDLD